MEAESEETEWKKQLPEYIRKGKKLSEHFLQFKFNDDPPWHYSDKENTFTSNQLVREITDMKKMHQQIPREDTVKMFRDLFILQMSFDEEVGLQNESKVKAVTVEVDKELDDIDGNWNDGNSCEELGEGERPFLETKNMLKAFRFFYRRQNDFQGTCFLSEDFVTLGHKILMKGLIKNAGYLAENDRITNCPIKLKKVKYPEPVFVNKVFAGFLDYANYIACYLMDKISQDITEEVVEEIIKFSAWFFYNFVSLHPFSDGNGRMSRLLFCYVQGLLSPFPVGVYNIFSPTSKMDYYKAICQAREDVRLRLKGGVDSDFKKNYWMYESKPSDLARMILECQWHAWKKLVSECETVSYERSLSDEYLQTGSLEEY